jgi:hypothetical protein
MPDTSSTPAYGDSTSRVGDFLRYPRRVLLEALEGGFSNEYFYTDDTTPASRIPNPYLYVKANGETAENSKLEIADGWTRELDKTNPRPIILCQRDSLSFQNPSIGALKDPGLPWSRQKTFATMTQVPLVFHCFAREDVESDELSLVVGLFFVLFREEHLKNTRIQSMSLPVVGAPTPIRTDSRVDMFDSPVSLTVTMTIGWRLMFGNLRNMTDFGVVANLPK